MQYVVPPDWMDTRSAHVAQIFLDLHSPSRMKQKDSGAEKENYVIRFERLNDQTIARQRIVKESNKRINELSINSDIISDHFILSYLLYLIYIEDSIISRIIVDTFFFFLFYVLFSMTNEFCQFTKLNHEFN